MGLELSWRRNILVRHQPRLNKPLFAEIGLTHECYCYRCSIFTLTLTLVGKSALVMVRRQYGLLLERYLHGHLSFMSGRHSYPLKFKFTLTLRQVSRRSRSNG